MFERLVNALKAGLAGARQDWAIQPGHLVAAAVLILIYPKDGEPHVLFTKRTNSVEYHKGEISFPGGAWEPGDADLTATALRETWEELGVSPEDVTVLGDLGDSVTGTGFVVRSIVGTIREGYAFRPSVAEIDSVIEVPLRALMDPAHRRFETRWIDGRPISSWSFVHGGHLIWGATAGIVRRLVETLEKSDWRAGE